MKCFLRLTEAQLVINLPFNWLFQLSNLLSGKKCLLLRWHLEAGNSLGPRGAFVRPSVSGTGSPHRTQAEQRGSPKMCEKQPQINQGAQDIAKSPRRETVHTRRTSQEITGRSSSPLCPGPPRTALDKDRLRQARTPPGGARLQKGGNPAPRGLQFGFSPAMQRGRYFSYFPSSPKV